MNANVKKLILRDFMGGLSPSLYYSGENQYQSGRGIDARIEPGVLQPGLSESNLTIVGINGLITKFVAPGYLGDEEFVYGYAESFICRIDMFNYVATNNATFVDGALPITNPDAGGMAEFEGKLYFANDTNYIGSFTPGATPTIETRTLAGLNTRTYSPMHQYGGVLYVGNLNYLYSYDGTATNAAALDIPTGFEIDHITDYADYLVFTASKFSGTPTQNITSSTNLYFWTPGNLSPTKIVSIPETRIKGMVQWKGGLYVLGENALYRFNGASFDALVNFYVANSYTGNQNIDISPTIQVEGLTTWKNYLVWPGQDSVMFYGNPPGIPPAIYSPFLFSTSYPMTIFGGRDDTILVAGYGAVRVVRYGGTSPTGIIFNTRRINFGHKVKIIGLRIFSKPVGSTVYIDPTFRYRAGTGEGAINFERYVGGTTSISEKFLNPDKQPIISNGYLNLTFEGIVSVYDMELWYEIVPDEPHYPPAPQA